MAEGRIQDLETKWLGPARKPWNVMRNLLSIQAKPAGWRIRMKIKETLIILVTLVVLLPNPAESQTGTKLEGESAVAEEGRRSPALAGVLDLLLPTAGHAYAGDWAKGLLPNAIRLGGLAFSIATMEEREAEIQLFSDTYHECTTVCSIGRESDSP